MSKAITDQGYVTGTSANANAQGRLGIWFFLAADAMFWIALFSSYILLRSGSDALFHQMSQVLSKPLGIAGAVVLVVSSVMMTMAVKMSRTPNRRATTAFLVAALACGAAFICIKAVEGFDLFVHSTIVARSDAGPAGEVYVYDGRASLLKGGSLELTGYRSKINLGEALDIHRIGPSDLSRGTYGKFIIPGSFIDDRTNYSPSKNMFFAWYFIFTGAHVVHLAGGMIAIVLLLIQVFFGRINPLQIDYVAIVWHFVIVLGPFLFSLLYLL